MGRLGFKVTKDICYAAGETGADEEGSPLFVDHGGDH